MSTWLSVERRDDSLQVNLQGAWVFANLGPLQQALDAIEPGAARQICFSCGGLHGFDTTRRANVLRLTNSRAASG